MRVVLLSVTVTLVGIAGCQQRLPRRVISAIPRNTSDAVFVSEHAGLSHEAIKEQLSIHWNGPNHGSESSQQIKLAEQAIKENDFGLVLSPAALFATDTVVDHALAEHVPVVILGQPVPFAARPGLSFVFNDAQHGAQLAAQRMHVLLGNSGKILLVGIDPMEPGTAECARAFEAALAEEAPGIRIVNRLVRTSRWGDSGVAMGGMLRQQPDVSAVYALNLDAVRAAVKTIDAMGLRSRVKIVGNDYALDLLYDMRHGQVDALVVPDMRSMGEQAVRDVVAAREGHTAPAPAIFEPVLVTRDNLDTEAIQQRIALDWRLPS